MGHSHVSQSAVGDHAAHERLRSNCTSCLFFSNWNLSIGLNESQASCFYVTTQN